MAKRNLARAAIMLCLLSSVGLSGTAAYAGARQGTAVVSSSARLTDLKPGVDPLDGASAHFIASSSNSRTRAIFIVTGISRAAVGMTFGAHVHIGPCVAGNGAAAGKHYNTGGPPSPTTEVWLDFTVRPGGVAIARTTVPFVIPEDAAHSVVIHAMATDPTGAAGPRLACLPINI